MIPVWIIKLTGVAMCLALVWLSLDGVYSLIIRFRYHRWNQAVERRPDGVRQDCEAFEVGKGSTSLLMVHGFADSPYLYKRLAPWLADQGFHSSCIRLPGFAEPINRYRDTSLEQWEAHLDAELDSLHDRGHPVWVVGHSMGAALSVMASVRQPDKIRGLILIAPLFNVAGTRSPLVKPRTWFILANPLLKFSDTVESMFPLDVTDTALRELYPRDKFVPVRVYQDLFRLIDELDDVIVKHPMLMILAAEDLVVDTSAALKVFEACTGSTKEQRVLKQTGHVIPWDASWIEAGEAIKAFIQSVEEPVVKGE